MAQSDDDIDMRHSSKKAWAMIKKLSSDPRNPGGYINVTPDQIVSVLLLNGKTTSPGGRTCQHIKRSRSSESQEGTRPFTVVEMSDAIINMRRGKASVVNDLTVEQIKQFGPITMNWLFRVFNNIMLKHNLRYDCFTQTRWLLYSNQAKSQQIQRVSE